MSVLNGSDGLVVFSGSAHPRFAACVAQMLGAALGACTVECFPDGELNVHIDEPVRNREVYLVQPTCAPVNDHLVELLSLADACRRASASRITAVMPYFGYGRSDKRHGRRAPINARMVAGLMESVGIGHLLTVDLHAPQIEGFFHIPVDSVTAVPALCHALEKRLAPGTVVVSPDEGRVRMAVDFARRLGLPLAVLHKERKQGDLTRVTRVVGEVRNRPCLIIDDMISTGGTIAESAAALLQAGAQSGMVVAATHGLFVADARQRLSLPSIREILVTDTVPFAQKDWPQVSLVPLPGLLAAAIRRFRAGESLGDLFAGFVYPSGEEDCMTACGAANDGGAG